MGVIMNKTLYEILEQLNRPEMSSFGISVKDAETNKPIDWLKLSVDKQKNYMVTQISINQMTMSYEIKVIGFERKEV